MLWLISTVFLLYTRELNSIWDMMREKKWSRSSKLRVLRRQS